MGGLDIGRRYTEWRFPAPIEKQIKLRIRGNVAMGLICGKSEGLVCRAHSIGRPTKTCDPQAVRQMPIDCGFDEIGSKEASEIVMFDFAHADAARVAISRLWRQDPRIGFSA